jgi:lysophospholipase L1-like esterase
VPILAMAVAVAGCGADVASASPQGALLSVRGGPGSIAVQGWALDPGTSSPITVDLRLDGVSHLLTADLPSPEPGAGGSVAVADHGFAATLEAGGGWHTVCANAIGTGDGSTTLLGCSAVVVPVGDPLGAIDVVSGADGTVSVSGWAFDPDTSEPIGVVVVSEGIEHRAVAGEPRPDVDRAYPGAGVAHGFHVTFEAEMADQEVCVSILDVGPGHDVLLSCVSVEGIPPFEGRPGGETVAVLGNSITALSVEELPVAFGDTYRSSSAGRSGRTIEELLPLAEQYAATDPDIVVVEAGSNDAGVPEADWSGLSVLAAEARMLATFPGARCIVWVNLSSHTTRASFDSHARGVNASLAHLETTDPRVVVADWDRATAGRSDLLIDGVHPNHAGQRTYAQVVRDAVDRCPAAEVTGVS